MRKYIVQVCLYTHYFWQVALDNLGMLLYTVVLPLVFLVLNLKSAFFKPLSMQQFIGTVMPFIAWIIFSNVLMVIADVAMLREQGYLKQYVSLVVNPSVFLVSEMLVSEGLLVVILGLVGAVSGIVFHLPIFGIVWRLWAVLLLVALPVLGYCLPILSLPIRYKSLNAVVNTLMIVVMIGSATIENSTHLAVTTVWLNVLSPIYLVMNTFNLLTTAQWGTFWPAYVATLVVMGLIGIYSYQHLRLLPTEGL